MTLIARMVCLSAIDGAESRFGSSMVIFTGSLFGIGRIQLQSIANCLMNGSSTTTTAMLKKVCAIAICRSRFCGTAANALPGVISLMK